MRSAARSRRLQGWAIQRRSLPAEHEAQRNPVIGRRVVVVKLAAGHFDAEPEGKDVVAHWREAPAEPPVVAAVRGSDAEIGRGGEAAAKDGEPVARFRLKAPAGRRAARRGQARQGLAVQERVCASRRGSAGRVPQRERETAGRGRVGVEGECSRYTPVAESAHGVGQQTVRGELCGKAAPGIDEGEVAAEFHAGTRLRSPPSRRRPIPSDGVSAAPPATAST